MNLNLKIAALLLLAGLSAHAQAYSVKAVLKDAQSGEAVSFATVSLHNPANDKGLAYELSDEDGKAMLAGVKPGKYVFKAELLGYKKYEQKIEIKDADLDLGTVKMAPDARMLEAAKVTDRGNPIQMKRDTIAFTASTFKTTDNDMLEDLLKKIPGMDISEDGTITHNGKEISKITIDGKTFFLNDPQIATKNLPAKVIDKLKVIEKKSDQAEFTGIDDGEEETILDLTVKPGMMNGVFGNVMGGAGHDIPSTDITGDWRWQTGGFVGNFTDKYQLSGVFNANNTNNRGFNDLAGSMMGGMRGGGGPMGMGQGGWGGGNGITTSYMAGLNGGTNLFDDKMELRGNYAFNGSERRVEETSDKTTHLEDSDLIYHSSGNSITGTNGHRFGMRMEHKFSENTSLIFEPRVNFGGGSFAERDSTDTYTYTAATGNVKTNDSFKKNSGDNKNLSASGFALIRQKLGIPGRTLTVMGRYSVSQNRTLGNNYSLTNIYDGSGTLTSSDAVNQNYSQMQNSYSAFARATFTQPLVENLYVEANVAYNWSKSISDKATTDAVTGAAVDSYSNHITNDFTSEEAGANLLYQTGTFRAQLGFAVIPSKTHNYTQTGAAYQVDTTITRLNWSPTAMLYTDLGENGSARIFYRGRSQTPSTNQLITVADNSNPLAVSFGNPNLAPYFSHNLNGDIRYNNKKTYASVNARFNGSYTQDPIVNAHWYTNGVTYSMPVNGPSSVSLGGNIFANVPLGKKFTLFNMLNVNWSNSASYVGTGINTTKYMKADGSLDYGLFFADYEDIRSKLEENRTRTFGFTERFRLTYRIDALELEASARTRMSHSNYLLADTSSETTTWNNLVSGSATWTVDEIGFSMKGDLDYRWYKGYTTQQPSEYVFNAEVSKQILNKKATVSLKGYDIFGQAKNLTVTDSSNVHTESLNNTLGRYVILSFTYRFGTFDRSKMRGPGGRMGPPPGR